jgi:predicted lipoprotein with Yx(FWY)xxD motif
MRTLLILIGLLAILGVVPAATAGPGAGAGAATLTVHTSRYGAVLFDGRGFALYTFSHDPRSSSSCSGACAKAWPPLLTKRTPGAGPGAKASLLGTLRRRDGTIQATYAGRPLYYYVGDTKAGQILCQHVSQFGGLWLVVRANGVPVR